jgi:hypothetical protein
MSALIAGVAISTFPYNIDFNPAAQHLLEITECMLHGDAAAMAQLKQAHIAHLQVREEIVS